MPLVAHGAHLGNELLGELIAFFDDIYPGRAARPGSVTTADEMALPHRGMYVVADARGRGVGRQLLAALEEADYFAEKVL